MKFIYKSILLSVFFLTACGGGKSDDDTPKPVPSPKAATLTFPNNNETCNEGTNANATQSTVLFQWNASQDTDSYEVNLKNIDSGFTTKTQSSTNEKSITIQRGTPYEWFVVSKAIGTNVTATSSTWKFYNQGVGIENYAPFPAEAVSPTRGSTISNTSTVTLKWIGSDVDNDIMEYEVLYGTDSNPTTSLGTTSDMAMDASITSGTTYYWKILTKDNQNNTSDSEVFQFKTE